MIYDSVFIDTNILLYFYDKQEKEKQAVAIDLLMPYLEGEKAPWISVQVLQEFTNRLLTWQVSETEINDALELLEFWPVIDNSQQLFKQGLKIRKKYNLSFWDSMIIAAAQEAKATEIWTEDLNHGQNYGGVKAKNPFG